MRTDDFHYDLPPGLIAQHPAPRRDSSRLLVLHRDTGRREHLRFPNLLDYFQPGDLLVLNNSKVIPARLRAFKPGTGGLVEVLLVEESAVNDWWVMLKPGKRVRRGTVLQFRDRADVETEIFAEVLEKNDEGHYHLLFRGVPEIKEVLPALGEVPLPPYIQRPGGAESDDTERYQTVFARPGGSVAAPTAGLHFTAGILDQIRARGVNVTEVTLHVGLGTFAPVKAAELSQHKMHSERYELSEQAAELIRSAKMAGARVFAAGTTSLRVIESVAGEFGEIRVSSGRTRLFVYPPYHFKVVDALLTNFHLPESSLLMLVSAFAAPGSLDGRRLILDAYAEAVRERYRFFSYGDTMLIL